MWSSPLLWIIVAIALFWAVGAYNRLVRLRSAVIQAFGSLDAHMLRWLAMLGEFDAAQVSTGALSEAARSALQGAATQWSASLAVARARPLQGDAVAALSAACAVLDAVWLGFVSGAQADEILLTMASWRTQWDELRAHNEKAVQHFNRAVIEYNAAIGQFPALLLAWIFGFSPAQTLFIAQQGTP